MVGWIVFGNFISKTTNIVLKIYKTLIRSRIEYYTLIWTPLSRHRNWRVILRMESIQRRETKMKKKKKMVDYFIRKKKKKRWSY